MRRPLVVPLVCLAGLLCSLGAPAASAGQRSIFADPTADDRFARAIANYRLIAEDGGWTAVEPGRTLRRGIIDLSVHTLRRRLVATRDLAPRWFRGRDFDGRVERAVRRFQTRHGLVEDGIVGPATLAALNLPAARRRALLELNRKRLAVWQRRIAGRGVVVNIPDAALVLLEDGKTVFRSRVVVGRPSWPTPILHSVITALDINPPWYVPPRIARREILPKARRDPGFLAGDSIRVLKPGPAGRKEIPYDAIDWDAARAGAYVLRQDPGPDSALGLVKFVFDNPHGVFLHDTPHKRLFAEHDRARSHGCVRVENAVALARTLAAREHALGADAVDAAIAAGKTRRLPLSRPVPIHLVYLTAWVDGGGRARFRGDLYRLDRPGTAADPALAPCGPAETAPASRG